MIKFSIFVEKSVNMEEQRKTTVGRPKNVISVSRKERIAIIQELKKANEGISTQGLLDILNNIYVNELHKEPIKERTLQEDLRFLKQKNPLVDICAGIASIFSIAFMASNVNTAPKLKSIAYSAIAKNFKVLDKAIKQEKLVFLSNRLACPIAIRLIDRDLYLYFLLEDDNQSGGRVYSSCDEKLNGQKIYYESLDILGEFELSSEDKVEHFPDSTELKSKLQGYFRKAAGPQLYFTENGQRVYYKLTKFDKERNRYVLPDLSFKISEPDNIDYSIFHYAKEVKAGDSLYSFECVIDDSLVDMMVEQTSKGILLPVYPQTLYEKVKNRLIGAYELNDNKSESIPNNPQAEIQAERISNSFREIGFILNDLYYVKNTMSDLDRHLSDRLTGQISRYINLLGDDIERMRGVINQLEGNLDRNNSHS